MEIQALLTHGAHAESRKHIREEEMGIQVDREPRHTSHRPGHEPQSKDRVLQPDEVTGLHATELLHEGHTWPSTRASALSDMSSMLACNREKHDTYSVAVMTLQFKKSQRTWSKFRLCRTFSHCAGVRGGRCCRDRATMF